MKLYYDFYIHSPVHVVSEGQDELQHLLQPLASLDLFGSLQNGLDLGLDLAEPNVEFLLVVKCSQPTEKLNFILNDCRMKR